MPPPAAITLLEAEYTLRTAAGGPAGAVRIRNMTIWCGASWEQAAPVADAAIRKANAELPREPPGAGSTAAASPAVASPPPAVPAPASASDDSRNFLIGTLTVACVGELHPLHHTSRRCSFSA